MAVTINGNGTITPTSAVQPAGSILQVVSGHNTGKTTVSNSGFTSFLTCPVTITPSSTSSKILVSVYTQIGRTPNGNLRVKLYRDISGGSTGTDLTPTSEVCWFGHWNDYSYYTTTSIGKTFVDTTHSTTSVITYKLYGDTEGTSVTGVIGGRPGDTFFNQGTDWVLMEVAG